MFAWRAGISYLTHHVRLRCFERAQRRLPGTQHCVLLVMRPPRCYLGMLESAPPHLTTRTPTASTPLSCFQLVPSHPIRFLSPPFPSFTLVLTYPSRARPLLHTNHPLRSPHPLHRPLPSSCALLSFLPSLSPPLSRPPSLPLLPNPRLDESIILELCSSRPLPLWSSFLPASSQSVNLGRIPPNRPNLVKFSTPPF